MNQKAEKPVLQGQRIKTRKRDEKEKYDPSGFRDSIVQGFNQAGSDLDKLSAYLQGPGTKLDYRRYAETLFDVLFAGGILAPGGTVVEDIDTTKASRTELCVFSANEEQLTQYYELFVKLFRRFIYLQRPFEEELAKILKFLKGFQPDERERLAKILALFFVNGLASAKVLASLFEDHLTKENISLDFVTILFTRWLELRDGNSIKSILRKCQLDARLLEFMPSTRRSTDHFQKHFQQAELTCLCEIQKSQENRDAKKDMLGELDEMITGKETVKDIALFVREHVSKGSIGENEAVLTVFHRLMKSVEWNKKEELVADQALRHLKTYAPLLADLAARRGRAQLSLLVGIQEYCYKHTNFQNVFQKIIVTLYKADVLNEDVIIKWYTDGHSPKGKSLFLEQTKQFVEWLQQAEEESDDDEEGEEEEEEG